MTLTSPLIKKNLVIPRATIKKTKNKTIEPLEHMIYERKMEVTSLLPTVFTIGFGFGIISSIWLKPFSK